jgi:hypothetical protein
VIGRHRRLRVDLPGDGQQRSREIGGGRGPVRVDQPLNQDAAKQRLMQGANRPGNPLSSLSASTP